MPYVKNPQTFELIYWDGATDEAAVIALFTDSVVPGPVGYPITWQEFRSVPDNAVHLVRNEGGKQEMHSLAGLAGWWIGPNPDGASLDRVLMVGDASGTPAGYTTA